MKYYLGLSGWHNRGHDASAALIGVQGDEVKIIGAVEEERFTGNRYALNELPRHALSWCLQQVPGGAELNDMDGIAFSWNWPLIYENRKVAYEEDRMLLDSMFDKANLDRLQFINHHKCHAASAYYPSGYEDAAIIVMDGQGEQESGSVWKAAGGGINLIATFNIAASLGYLYQAASSFVGLGTAHAGKTMGLSSYGLPIYADELNEQFSLNGAELSLRKYNISECNYSFGTLDEEEQMVFYWLKYFTHLCKVPPNALRKDYDFTNFPKPYADLAASVQKTTSDLLLKLVRNVQDLTQCDNLCLAGGSFLNCMANGQIANSGLFKNIFIQPAANDAGAALGAAFLLAGERQYVLKDRFTPLLGPEYSSEEIMKQLAGQGIPYKFKESFTREISQFVLQGQTVGLFQGKMEFGPRALGNRSIIASPSARGMREHVNKKIKRRENGRPFGPSIIEDDVSAVFGDALINEHMTISQEVQASALTEIIHVDGTTRPNLVTRDTNPLYYSQLKAIKEATGYGVVINTSLNCDGPIVNTPLQACELLNKTALNHIVFNNQILVSQSALKESM